MDHFKNQAVKIQVSKCILTLKDSFFRFLTILDVGTDINFCYIMYFINPYWFMIMLSSIITPYIVYWASHHHFEQVTDLLNIVQYNQNKKTTRCQDCLISFATFYLILLSVPVIGIILTIFEMLIIYFFDFFEPLIELTNLKKCFCINELYSAINVLRTPETIRFFTIAELFFESIPQMFLQAYIFTYYSYKLTNDDGSAYLTTFDIALSISAAICNIILNIMLLRKDAYYYGLYLHNYIPYFMGAKMNEAKNKAVPIISWVNSRKITCNISKYKDLYTSPMLKSSIISLQSVIDNNKWVEYNYIKRIEIPLVINDLNSLSSENDINFINIIKFGCLLRNLAFKYNVYVTFPINFKPNNFYAQIPKFWLPIFNIEKNKNSRCCYINCCCTCKTLKWLNDLSLGKAKCKCKCNCCYSISQLFIKQLLNDLGDLLNVVDKKSRRAGGMVLIHASSSLKNPHRYQMHNIDEQFQFNSTFNFITVNFCYKTFVLKKSKKIPYLIHLCLYVRKKILKKILYLIYHVKKNAYSSPEKKMLREHCYDIIENTFNLFENIYKNIFNELINYNDMQINITDQISKAVYNNFFKFNKKHIPTFLYNDWISLYKPAKPYHISKISFHTKNNLNQLSHSISHVLVNYNSFNKNFYFRDCDEENPKVLNVDENEYDYDQENHNFIQWSTASVSQWTFIKSDEPNIGDAESFIITTMDGRYKLIIKNNKLFVRDDKNILFKNQKPSTIYVKNYIDNTNNNDEFKNNLILNNENKITQQVNIKINETEKHITI